MVHGKLHAVHRPCQQLHCCSPEPARRAAAAGLLEYMYMYLVLV